MSQEYCRTAQRMCDPNDCGNEYCWWRDLHAIKKLGQMGYTLKPVENKDKQLKPANSSELSAGNREESNK